MTQLTAKSRDVWLKIVGLVMNNESEGTQKECVMLQYEVPEFVQTD
jgi:hypothetical protein